MAHRAYFAIVFEGSIAGAGSDNFVYGIAYIVFRMSYPSTTLRTSLVSRESRCL